MFSRKPDKLFLRLMLISVMVVLTFTVSGGLYAQEETPTVEPTATEAPTLEPTQEATVVPTEAPTEVPPPTIEPSPTLEPTQEATDAPTSVPTDAPTTEPTQEATEALTSEPTSAPTTEPTQEATEALTETPTIASAPPVFNFTNGTVFEGIAGTPLAFQISVSDEMGQVSVTADTTTSAGSVSLVTTAPVETTLPFNTLVDVTYVAPVDFSGADTFTLIAADAAGVVTSASVTVNVSLPEATAEVTETPAPTDIPLRTRELLINYNPAATEESIQAMLAALSAVELDRIPQIGAMRVLLPETVSQPATAMSALQANTIATAAGVTNVESNGFYHALYTPNDPMFSTQWGLGGGSGGIFASFAWDISTRRGTGITVAVLDSGVDFQHPDLTYQLLTTGWDFVNDDNNPDDDFGHGTEVAGIIAARTNNTQGIAGVAFLAKIMPVKVLDDTGSGSYFHIAAGIVHAVDRGARIINLSLGSTDPSSTIEGAINYALSRNVVVIAASGNNGDTTNDPVYPAYYPGVISVGAHDSTGTIAAFSTNNNQVDISAPGVGILSTVPVELDTDGTADGYTTDDGTSFAAPHVSGVAALLMSASIATTPATVSDALRCGAEDAGAAGYDNFYGNGRLIADYSMNWRSNSASCQVTLANDNFEAAARILRVPFSATSPVHSRSISEQTTDPQICGAQREQTLWYTFRPTVSGNYQISTLGSSYNTVIGVYLGSAGALSEVGCSISKQASIALERYLTYYIAVGTNGAAVDDQVLELRVNAAIPRNNYDYQENSVNIAYSGSWARRYLLGSSGGYTQQTYDQEATASFSFRGTSFDYARTIGPSQGQVFVYINDVLVTTVNNRAAITRSNQVINVAVPGGMTGQWNTVRIMRDPAVAGMIDVDRIRTYDFDSTTLAGTITSRVDDRHSYLRYFGSWTNQTLTTAYYRTLKETGVENDYLVFRARGNAITIYRMTGPGFADMEVTIDNGTPFVVSNAGTTTTILPYTIDGLVYMDHVVVIRKLGAANIIQLDSVQASLLGTLTAGYTYNDRVVQLAYRGTWTDANVTGAYSGNVRTLDANSEVSFKFSGNDLCIGYQRVNTGNLQIYFDGTLFDTLPADAGGGFTSWCLDANNGQLLADVIHYARLVPSGGTFTLDYVRPLRYRTITPTSGIVQENNTSLRYSSSASWITLTTTTGSSSGGYRPQGGYLRSTTEDDTTITFYINGTGFILYTTVGPGNGCWEITVDGVALDPVDLTENLTISRYTPLGYGVTGLTPGIHQVVLIADTDCSSLGFPLPSNFYVDFDAIRVFP